MISLFIVAVVADGAAVSVFHLLKRMFHLISAQCDSTEPATFIEKQ